MTNETQDRTLTLSLWKAITVLATAILGTGVVTGFGVITTLNSDHFILARAVLDLDELESRVALKAELDPRLSNIEANIQDIKQDLREIKLAIK